MADRALRRRLRGELPWCVSSLIALAAEQLRTGARDPRACPKAGDVVRAAMHGADGLWRWDVRELVACSEAALKMPDHSWGWWCHDMLPSPHVHWRRQEESWRALRGWGLARHRQGTLSLKSWVGWCRARRVEVVRIAGG